MNNARGNVRRQPRNKCNAQRQQAPPSAQPTQRQPASMQGGNAEMPIQCGPREDVSKRTENGPSENCSGRMSSDQNETRQRKLETPRPTEHTNSTSSRSSCDDSSGDPIDMSMLSIHSATYPSRPDVGKLGSPIPLETNHFLLQYDPNMVVYHYSVSMMLEGKRGMVDITNKVQGMSSTECRSLCVWGYKKLFEEEPHKNVFCQRFLCTYDGRSNMYTLNELNLGRSGVYQAHLRLNEMRELIVTVKPCDVFQLSISDIVNALSVQSATYDRSALQVMDVITNMQLVVKNEYFNFGQCFYKSDKERQYIGNAFELYDGFLKSLRFVRGFGSGAPFVLSVNVESKKAPFYAEGELLDSVMDELCLRDVPNQPLSDADIFKLRRRFKGVKVRAMHTSHCFKISDISNCTPLTYRFNETPDGPTINVFQYFQNRYKIKLRYPHLPLVFKGRCALPIEVLSVLPGQKVSLTQLTENNQREVIQRSAVPPFFRRQDILEKCKEIGLQPSNRFAQAFRVSMKPEMMKLSGRVLSNPVVQYAAGGQNNGAVMVNNGVWDMRSQGVFLSANVRRWAVLNMSDIYKNKLDVFLQRLTAKASLMGVRIEQNYVKYVELRPNEMFKLNGIFETLVRVDAVAYVICVLPEYKEDARSQVKFAGEVCHGLTTQCLRKKTVLKGLGDRGTDTLFLQIALKVNAKNGGVNNEVKANDPIAAKWIKKGVMYVGFDVNHPPALSRAEIEMNKVPTEPSVVGAVANSGRTLFDYRMCYKLQDARQESINRDVIHDVMKRFLKEYELNNKQLPTNVIVYRDGVADTQFPMVVENELRYITESFGRYKANYSPKLTLLVVQKRHHTRFFKTKLNPNDRCAQQNIPAGTVVDSGPVSPVLFDFYLCSHVGIQGTSKPAQYTVLYDENGFNADTIQTLSYLLCQTYQKCNRSVSLPAPVYHAHHAATTGKILLLAVCDTRRAGAKFGNPAVAMNLKEMEEKISLHANVSKQMVWA